MTMVMITTTTRKEQGKQQEQEQEQDNNSNNNSSINNIANFRVLYPRCRVVARPRCSQPFCYSSCHWWLYKVSLPLGLSRSMADAGKSVTVEESTRVCNICSGSIVQRLLQNPTATIVFIRKQPTADMQ